jgi:hypothetical protein
MRKFIATVLELMDCVELLTGATRKVAGATIAIIDEMETVVSALEEKSHK